MKDLINSRSELFPISTTCAEKDGHVYLTIGGCDLTELAEKYGTPLYVYDRATMDENVRIYREALATKYPAVSGITYAGKAYLCLAIAQWTKSQDLWLDCTGIGELSIASIAGIQPQSVVLHGVNKTKQDLTAGFEKAGTIVVDNLTELDNIVDLVESQANPCPELWLRLRPGTSVDSHPYTQTGQLLSKFGMNAAEILTAVNLCKSHRLSLNGLHFHLGSHFHDPSPLKPAIETALRLLALIRAETGWYPQTLSTGGGWGVAYHEDDLPYPSVVEYISVICHSIVKGCTENKLSLPRLQIEPGRSLVAQAGVAVYQVGVTKKANDRRWILLDGGLADNPRPALYGARYSALPVIDPGRPYDSPTWLAGPYCESGDVLIDGLPMADLEPGEWVAIPTSGAYQLSMGSNYNGARRPAVVWVDRGKAFLIQRRETTEDLIQRDFDINL